jgi:excisionase family DNA binding protein
MDDIMLTAEVARFLGKSPETIRVYERRGKLRAMRTRGGVRLFRREDVQQLATLLATEAKTARSDYENAE